MKSILSLILLFATVTITGQEICNNGIDDDGDALIDMNDPDCSCSVYVPNAFTPDGDGNNDQFYPKFNCPQVTDYEMTIYDRWGQEVFSTVDRTARWNGSIEGSAYFANQNIYAYEILYTDADAQETGRVRLQGKVMLLR